MKWGSRRSENEWGRSLQRGKKDGMGGGVGMGEGRRNGERGGIGEGDGLGVLAFICS